MWNEGVGNAWVDNASFYDAQLEPYGHAAMDRLDLQAGQHVLDIGCGTGATTIDLAARVAPGSVLGVDLSATMLTGARARAAAAGVDTVSFREVDVQTGDLGNAAFDVAYSRVGVMFFSDPVAAFTNIAGSLRPGGKLGFVCFQEPSANPFMTLPIMSVAEILSLPPVSDVSGPNPFSLSDRARTAAILQSAGFSDIEIVEGPDHAEFPVEDDLHALARRILVQNPLTNPRFASADEATRAAALDTVVDVLAPHQSGNVIRIAAGTLLVNAHT